MLRADENADLSPDRPPCPYADRLAQGMPTGIWLSCGLAVSACRARATWSNPSM
jgi:hypothetical protein